MSISLLVLILLAGALSNVAGMVSLKQAVAGGNAVWAMVGAGCWVSTACLTYLALQGRPLVFVSVVSTGLSVGCAILVGHLVFGEPLRAGQLVAIALLLLAIAINAVSST